MAVKVLSTRIALATAIVCTDKLLICVNLACTLSLLRSGGRMNGILDWVVLQLRHS